MPRTAHILLCGLLLSGMLLCLPTVSSAGDAQVTKIANADAGVKDAAAKLILDAGSKDAVVKAATKAATKAAPLPVVDPNNPVQQVHFIVEAFRTGKWAWAVGLLLMLLTFFFNKLLSERIPKKVVPWIAIALGIAGNVAMSFASGAKWYTAISNGLTMGLAAVGGWEAIGKLFRSSDSGSTSTPASGTPPNPSGGAGA